jgi:CheY-like chemotaxis protein
MTGPETPQPQPRHSRAAGDGMPRVLVVDDEPQLVRALAINLRARKYQVDAAQDGAGALQLAAGRHPT